MRHPSLLSHWLRVFVPLQQHLQTRGGNRHQQKGQTRAKVNAQGRSELSDRL
jgi:hypothetical protein